MAASLTELFDVLNAVNVVAYTEIAAGALFVYDYCLTFSMEVDLVWRSKWNLIKCLYLFQRYLPIYDTLYVSLYRHLGHNMSKDQCHSLLWQLGFGYMTGVIASDTLLCLRIWALWNRDRRFFIVFPTAFCTIWVPGLIAMYFTASNIEYASVPPYPNFVGCFITAAKPYVIWSWLSLLLFDAISLIFILIPGVRHFRSGTGSASRLTSVVYYDGAFYYIFLFFFALTNIILNATLKPATRPLLTGMTRALHSMLASRVLLHMRENTSTRSAPHAVSGIQLASLKHDQENDDEETQRSELDGRVKIGVKNYPDDFHDHEFRLPA